MIFTLGPFLLGGLGSLVTYFSIIISENNKIKNYLETPGNLVSYDNCQYSDGSETCEAIYEYVVDGTTYKATSNISSERSTFDKTIIIKYNPNNPSENAIPSNMTMLLIIGIIFT